MLDMLSVTLPLTATQSGILPRFSGALWRSAMGMHLRRALCFTELARCTACPAREHCQYAQIMEAPSHDGAPLLQGRPDAPRPYVLRPDTTTRWRSGQSGQLQLLLPGHLAHRHAPVLGQALMQAARGGIGIDGQLLRFEPGTLTLQRIPLPPAPATSTTRVELELLTPLSLRVQNQYLRPEQLDFRTFFAALIRRISQLGTLYQQTPLQLDFAALAEHARSIHLDAGTLQWHRQQRYSARQKASYDINGILGTLHIEGALAPFLPWLSLGQYTHLGKGTVMGMGAYRLVNFTST